MLMRFDAWVIGMLLWLALFAAPCVVLELLEPQPAATMARTSGTPAATSGLAGRGLKRL
jgi:hypothetical protein